MLIELHEITRKYIRNDEENSSMVDIIASNKISQRKQKYSKQTWGGFSRGIMKRTRIGWISAKGGSPFAISIAVIPKDHISACIRKNLTMTKNH